MTSCECGCGGTPVRGAFLPGHDQKLRTDLEHRVGGLPALRSLVEASEQFASSQISSEALAHRVRALLTAAKK